MHIEKVVSHHQSATLCNNDLLGVLTWQWTPQRGDLVDAPLQSRSGSKTDTE